jgi:hypothetical protein
MPLWAAFRESGTSLVPGRQQCHQMHACLGANYLEYISRLDLDRILRTPFAKICDSIAYYARVWIPRAVEPRRSKEPPDNVFGCFAPLARRPGFSCIFYCVVGRCRVFRLSLGDSADHDGVSSSAI